MRSLHYDTCPQWPQSGRLGKRELRSTKSNVDACSTMWRRRGDLSAASKAKKQTTGDRLAGLVRQRRIDRCILSSWRTLTILPLTRDQGCGLPVSSALSNPEAERAFGAKVGYTRWSGEGRRIRHCLLRGGARCLVEPLARLNTKQLRKGSERGCPALSNWDPSARLRPR